MTCSRVLTQHLLAAAASLLLCALAATCSQAQEPAAHAATQTGSAPAYMHDPKVVQSLNEGVVEMKRHQFDFAADSFRKANKAADGACNECLVGLYKAQLSSGRWKDAVATAMTLNERQTDDISHSSTLMMAARAQMSSNHDKPKPEQLEAAHALLVQSVAADPKNYAALMLDGTALAKLGKLDAAKSSFAQCASCAPANTPLHLRAEHFASDPVLSTEPTAPAFALTTLDGKRFELDAMAGRVVLIDFWATWCGPCNAELPHMKKLAEKFKDEPLVILSVSWDSDVAKWKEFIAKNGMTWPQFRDANHKLTEAFGVQAIPHYFTIDSDGVLTSEMLGEGSDVEGKLKKLLARAHAQPWTHAAVQAGQ